MILRGLALLAVLGCAQAGTAQIVAARYTEPTDRYAHGVLGDAIEWGALEFTLQDGTVITHRLPQARVFEDTRPRLAVLDDTGLPKVIVVESERQHGASLAIYDEAGKHAATPHIGRPNRWLAPIGVADLDGDGRIEIAYIDRPHLARLLKVWAYVDGHLIQVAERPGYTNHRIGETDIAGGIRDCDAPTGRPEMIVVSADWNRLLAVTLRNGGLHARDIGPHRDRQSFADALACP